LISVGIFREIIHLKRNVEKDNKLPFFYALRWYLFGVTVFFVYRRFLANRIDRVAATSPLVAFIIHYHSMISYALICLGLVFFVLSLRRFTLRYQFQQLSWTLMTLIVVVAQAGAQIANIYNGLIWFLLPTSLVICNDIFAFIFGFFFGRTRLIALSPKKTWEGFIGGSLATAAWAWVFTAYLESSPVLICPMQDITLSPFNFSVECSEFNAIRDHLPYDSISPLWYDFTTLKAHALLLSVFASLVAPFGGFFASGFKRAFKIKDFGDSIPGHGGVTDRFDCQIIMGMFTYIYIHTFAIAHKSRSLGVDGIILAAMSLSAEDRMKVLEALRV